MPYAYVEKINHVFDTDHLKVYVTFRHQMQRSVIPQATPPVYDWYPLPAKWLLEADEVPIDIISSEWLDEFTLFLTSDTVASEPTGVTLEYAGPDEKLCYRWGKQIEPWGPRASFAGYPTTPAPHNSTHENGGSDEIQISGLSGLLNDTQHSFIDRGDPAAYDFTKANLTLDGYYHDLDLSAIVPAEARAVLLRTRIRSTTVNAYIRLKKKGNVNDYNVSQSIQYLASAYISAELTQPIGTDGLLELWGSSEPWNNVDIVVKGWWL
jgi:hypothetical protein